MTTKLNCFRISNCSISPQTVHLPIIKDKKKLYVQDKSLTKHRSVEDLFESIEEQNHLSSQENLCVHQKEILFLKRNNICEYSNTPKRKQNENFICVKPEFYSFTPSQFKLDQEITQCIKNGEPYSNIQDKLF